MTTPKELADAVERLRLDSIEDTNYRYSQKGDIQTILDALAERSEDAEKIEKLTTALAMALDYIIKHLPNDAELCTYLRTAIAGEKGEK